LLFKNIRSKIYRTVIFPVVLYGCETWSPTLREGHKLRVFENVVLRKIFGPKEDEVTGDWRRLLNEEFHDFSFVPNVAWVVKRRRMRWVGHVACMETRRGVYRDLQGSLKERDYLEDLDIDGWMIRVLKWTSRNRMARCGLH
jgi:hypothetical protein